MTSRTEFQPHFSYTFYAPADVFAETVAFYRDRLGWPQVDSFGGPNDASEGVFIGAARGLIEIISDREVSPFKDSVFGSDLVYRPPAGGFVVIEVADVEELGRRLVTEGVALLHDAVDRPWGVRELKLRDPCGNMLSLFSRITA